MKKKQTIEKVSDLFGQEVLERVTSKYSDVLIIIADRKNGEYSHFVNGKFSIINQCYIHLKKFLNKVY